MELYLLPLWAFLACYMMHFIFAFIFTYYVNDRYKPKGRGFDFRWWHWNFSLTQSFRPHYGPGVDPASNRNEYQEYFLGVRAAGAYDWKPYHLHVLTALKSGSLNFLEPSGPAQACNGIALPLPLPLLRRDTLDRGGSSSFRAIPRKFRYLLSPIGHHNAHKTDAYRIFSLRVLFWKNGIQWNFEARAQNLIKKHKL